MTREGIPHLASKLSSAERLFEAQEVTGSIPVVATTWCTMFAVTRNALLAELADALDLGSSTRGGVRVRVSQGAQQVVRGRREASEALGKPSDSRTWGRRTIRYGHALVAQLAEASDSGSEGCGFESHLVHNAAGRQTTFEAPQKSPVQCLVRAGEMCLT